MRKQTLMEALYIYMRITVLKGELGVYNFYIYHWHIENKCIQGKRPHR